MARILGPAIFTGTVASLASTAALALLARSQGKAAVQPTNSTSHWLHGDKAALVRGSMLLTRALAMRPTTHRRSSGP